MLRFFQTYHFFVLTIFLGIPAWWLVCQHPLYKKQTALIAVFVLPFAFTERFFVPTYWMPRFIGPFFELFGAGIEDVLFVIHLAWITAYSPLDIFRRDWGKHEVTWDANVIIRVTGLVVVVLGSFLVAFKIGLNPLFSAGIGMLSGMALMLFAQPRLSSDLGRGLLAGGSIYFLICLVYGTIYPQDFKTTWRTIGLSGQFILGVPFEEVAYGLLAGGLGGSFIPFLQQAPTRARDTKRLSVQAN